MLDNLPLTFSKCPQCGSEERVFEAIIKELKETKALPNGYGSKAPKHHTGIVQTLPLVDPNHPPVILSSTVMVKAIEACIDYCADCGNMYMTHCEVIDQPVPVQIQQMPGPGGKQSGLPRNFS